MSTELENPQNVGDDDAQIIEPVGYDFGLSRRTFVQVLGAGLLIAAAAPVLAQERGQGGSRGSGRQERRAVPLDARLHLGKDGVITVMTGKVECGQGARAEITQAAAEELGVSRDVIQLLMADTALTPDDGITAGSRTTPSTIPSIRQSCAGARTLLITFAAKKWNVPAEQVKFIDGVAKYQDQQFSYANLASESGEALKAGAGAGVIVTATEKWNVLGTPVGRPNGRDIVTGKHQYPFDVVRPGMVYGKVLRSPTYRGKLKSVDLSAAKGIEGVTPVRDGEFVGVVAPNNYRAKLAISALEKTAQWDVSPAPSSKELYDYLRKHAKDIPENPLADIVSRAAKKLRATYHVPYVQHAPMEPRSAVAEWKDGGVTIWTGTQNPFGVRSEVARAFHIPEERVRVIAPDFGGGFGGKHTGEVAVEAARLAQAGAKPVSLQWTREEEFNWATFRPAAVIDIEASLDEKNNLSSWHFVNINSGPSAVESPYRGKNHCKFVGSDAVLRHGSYRALAATANVFARESFMDELAQEAQRDPLEFRLAHLDDPRLKAVLEAAAKRFNFSQRWKNKSENTGVGLACGTDKGGFVAACVEVAIDPANNAIRVRHVAQAFEAGAILNPANLLSQVQGAIIQGLGPALRESIDLEENRVSNASFWKYPVPRFADLPTLDIQLINRLDLPSSGAGECPLIALAPAIANAVCHATGKRVREMPLRLTSSTTNPPN
jgi:isoquinoline 1-oxidoreductase beta subunit